MHIITPYAPPTHFKPCLIVSTLFNSRTKETALQFVDALNVWHAMERNIDPRDKEMMKIAPSLKKTNWIVIQKHLSAGTALEFHLALTKNFVNGGSNEEWNLGWTTYSDLYERYFPETGGLKFDLMS